MVAERAAKHESPSQADSTRSGRHGKTPGRTSINSDQLHTLRDYYENERLPAALFLAALKKNKVTRLTEDDIDNCLSVLDERDPDFLKTLDLQFRAAHAQTPLARQCLVFASRACKQQLARHYGTELDPSGPASITFAATLRAVKEDLTEKERDIRSLNLMKAVGIWQTHSRNLDPMDVLLMLTGSLSPRRRGGEQAVPDVIDILFKPNQKLKPVTDILLVAEHALTQAKHARDAESRERQQKDKEFRRAQDYLEQLTTAKGELSKREDEIADLIEKVKHLENDNRILDGKLEQQQAVRSHSESELKGRSRVFLEKRIDPLLETAHEFAELDPPRKNIILERLEMAREEIRREIECLRSMA